MEVKEKVDNLDKKIIRKINEMEDADATMGQQLEQLLYRYRDVFDERPGRIRGYEHHFTVCDKTPYLQRG